MKADRWFAALLIALALWMGWFDWHDPADLVAREFIAVLGGLSGLYVFIRTILLEASERRVVDQALAELAAESKKLP